MRLGNPSLAIDSKAEENGRWLDCPSIWWRDANTPMRILLRGANSQAHQAFIRKITKGLNREQLEERAVELSAKIGAALVAGWEGWFDCNGEPVRYSVDMALAVLENPDNRRLLDFISRKANELETFNAERREEIEKN